MIHPQLSRESFEAVRPILEASKARTRPRIHDLYDIYCAVLYLASTGVAWRQLPPNFPPWRTVHQYFLNWTAPNADGSTLLGKTLPLAGYADIEEKVLAMVGRRSPFLRAH